MDNNNYAIDWQEFKASVALALMGARWVARVLPATSALERRLAITVDYPYIDPFRAVLSGVRIRKYKETPRIGEFVMSAARFKNIDPDLLDIRWKMYP